MLVIRVELWPHGDQTKASVIAEGRIINDLTSPSPHYGQYAVEWRERAQASGHWRRWHSGGVIRWWRRQEHGPLALVQEALQRMRYKDGYIADGSQP